MKKRELLIRIFYMYSLGIRRPTFDLEDKGRVKARGQN
jgi:hypothetical protein